MYIGSEVNIHIIPPFSQSSQVAYSESTLIYLGISLELLWSVWHQFSVRYSLVLTCTCSQNLKLPLKCSLSLTARLYSVALPLLGQSPYLSFPQVVLLCFQVFSVSDLCPNKRGQKWSLTCSVVLWRGRNTANAAGTCVESQQWLEHTGVCTAQGTVHLPGSQAGHEDIVPHGPCVPSGE